MNQHIRWGLPDDGHTTPIYAGPPQDMDRVAEFANERGVKHIRFGGDQWRLQENGALLEAVTPTGAWRAQGDGDSLKQSETVVVDADRHHVTITAEDKNNFVLDLDGMKAGQFSAANRGVRNLHVEFEGEGAGLPLDVQVFLSFVARTWMEDRMVSSTWRLTVGMLLLIPFVIAYWVLFK